MRERKPYWRDVPQDLRLAIEATMKSPVARGHRVFGGYGPSATFRIRLADGRTLFAKGAGKGSNEVNWRVVPTEEGAYRGLASIRPIAPAFFGSVTTDGWHLLLLEDLSRAARVPPWTEELALGAMRDIAAFHLRGMRERGKVQRLEPDGMTDNWRGLREDPVRRGWFLGLYGGRRQEAGAWLEEGLERLAAAEARLLDANQPWSVIHTDIRSDNLRFRRGRLVLFDWALVCDGPCILDLYAFLPSLVAEGGTEAPRLLPAYRAAMAAGGAAIPGVAEQAAASAVAGYFAMRAGQPPIPGLPRLREVQRMQLATALDLAAVFLGLPLPPRLPAP